MAIADRIVAFFQPVLVPAMLLCVVSYTAAQPVAAMQANIDISSGEEAPKTSGFSIKKEDEKVNEQLQDFARYRDKKAWDRAFKALAAAGEFGVAGGLSPAGDGFFVPTRIRLFRNLLSLPPAGREAYRLFNDAKAKQQWDAVLAKNGVETISELQTLVDRYFITVVGPRAADRLGDAYLEAGQYAAAAQAFGQLLEASATGLGDDSLPPLRIRFKTAVALARAHQAESFATILRQIRERFAGEKLSVGGREIDPVAYLESLATAASAPPTMRRVETGVAVASPPITLPADNRPSWQMQFLDADLLDRMFAVLQNNGWAMQATAFAKIVPPTASDGQQVYANWCGIVFAINARTGKLLWRTGKFTDVADKFQELVQNGVDPSRYALELAGDSVLAVSMRLDKLGSQDPFRLYCHSTETGEKQWSSETGPLEKFAFVGKPLLIGRTIYIAATPKESQEALLLAISLDDGKLYWQMPLGTPQAGTNYRGMAVSQVPAMLHDAGTLYFLTNNGALLSIDLASHTLNWAFTYEVPPVQNQNMSWNPYAQMLGTIAPRGVVTIRNGILYLKECGMSVIFALDPAGPSVLWHRAAESSDMLAGIDGKQLYLLGINLSAVELASRTMIWSPAIPVQADSVEPVLAGGLYYVFTGRGIYSIDTATQEVKIFRGYDHDSFGGNLLRSGDRLLSISNLSITAYKVTKADH